MTFICRPASVDIEFLLKKKAKRNLLSTIEIRDVLDGISETCSMIVYFYI